MPEWIATIVSPIVTVIVVPIVAYMIKQSENRAKKRDEAHQKFNAFMLQGMAAIGGLAKANTIALKNKEVTQETEDALEEYNRFHHELTTFTSQQTAKTF
jgi:hypothetical protein